MKIGNKIETGSTIWVYDAYIRQQVSCSFDLYNKFVVDMSPLIIDYVYRQLYYNLL